ncbi:hypothetical protein D1AOALGA4SA_5271 [Olavius algarvensis Delta 1 endosymbiont]|nr:hypothetical protein D1AOALGA4SA_5271 [Olavius algarvensis Delta 1 endosymbiont]
MRFNCWKDWVIVYCYLRFICYLIFEIWDLVHKDITQRLFISPENRL